MNIRGFISYTHSDQKHAERLSEKLRVLGVDVWRDRYHMSAGSHISETIGNAIEKDTDVMFVLVSANALFAPWVQWENDRASNAAAVGHHLKVVYVVVEKFTLPEEIQNHVYIDFTVNPGERTDRRIRRELEATENLARYLLSISPHTRLGVYDIFHSYADLDRRREKENGSVGANVYEFARSALKRMMAVGFFFGHLFGMEGGSTIASWIKSHVGDQEASIELFIPDPDIAPLDNLKLIYPHGEQIPGRIRDFISMFESWGKQMRLTQDESQLISLKLLKCCPTASFFTLDPYEATGRVVVSFSPTGYGPEASDNLFHVELRYPQTPIYQHILDSLHFVQRDEMQTKSISTNHMQ